MHHYQVAEPVLRFRLHTPEKVVRFITDRLPELTKEAREHFLVVLLNTNLEPIDLVVVSIGTLDNSLVHPREVFRPAIASSANSIILAHNHPSGNLEPSQQDLAITRQLVEAGKLIQIAVLDHLIISTTGYRSLKEHGEWWYCETEHTQSLRKVNNEINKPTSKNGETSQNPDTQYDVEILRRSGDETISLSIDQIVDICNKEDLWAFQNGRLVQPELICKGAGKIILTRALVGG